jgi:hypothetical protein
VSGPDHPRLRVVDADSSFLSQIEAATERFVATSGNPPPLPWFIEEWVPADETTLLAGPGSGGKSYLALQMQASAALGVPIGRRSPRIRGPYSMPIHSAVRRRRLPWTRRDVFATLTRSCSLPDIHAPRSGLRPTGPSPSCRSRHGRSTLALSSGIVSAFRLTSRPAG